MCYSSNNDHKSITAKKKVSSQPPVIVVLLLMPPSSPHQLHSFKSASLYQSGWLLCLFSGYSGRDDCPRWMNSLFIFCRIIHPARLIVVLLQTFFTPAFPRPHTNWLLCRLCCFCGPAWPLSFRSEVNSPPVPSFTCSLTCAWPRAVVAPKMEVQSMAPAPRPFVDTSDVVMVVFGVSRLAYGRGRHGFEVVVRGIHKRWEQSFVDPRKIN